jgi:hypothetical protein
VNAVFVLVALLVLSYAGSFLAGTRTIRGVGLPSSVEYVVLGFVLGPHVLGIVPRELVETFEPLTRVALGWLALLIGLDFGRAGDRRAGIGAMTIGVIFGAVTGVAVAAATWFTMLRLLHAPADRAHVIMAGGVGVVGAETTRHVVRWAAERYGATGRLTRLLDDLAQADALAPLVAMAVLFSLEPVTIERFHSLPLGAWVGVTIGFGVVLGFMTAMHIGRELRVDPTWGVLLGMSVLGIGVAVRLGLSSLTVLFFMGWTTAALSRHRAAIRAMVVPLERPILLPALVLAGAYVDFRATPKLAVIVAAAVGARLVAKLVLGGVLALPLRASPLLGAGLFSTGALSISIGLAFAIRFPGAVGGTVLATAFVLGVAGELVGPVALKRVLASAGELEPPPPPSAPDDKPAADPEPAHRDTDAPKEAST